MASARGARSKPQAWELRAQVRENSFSFLEKQALEADRPRSKHVGRVVDAFAQVSEKMTPAENAKLDSLFIQPDALLALLREALRTIT